MFLFKV